MSKTPSRKLQTRNKLKEGETYTFQSWEQNENYIKVATSKRIRLIQKYRHFALFEYTSGIRECFSYWEIRKMMDGKVVGR